MDQAREFRLVVEKAYSIPGRGTLVTGKIERGRISVGDEIGFLGGEGRYLGGQVVAIEVSRSLVEVAEAGQEASILLKGVKRGQIAAGTVLTAAPEAPPVSSGPSASEMPSYESASPPPMPHSAGPIHPGSSLGRTVFFIVIGVLLLLLLLFYLGKWDPKQWDPKKWDPRKRLTSIEQPASSLRLAPLPFSPPRGYEKNYEGVHI